LTSDIFPSKESIYWWATQGTKAGLKEVIGWVSKGKIKPVIDTILPFSTMVEGHVRMADSQLFGKILTTPQRL
jgi:alcohol dehydrogenase